MEYTQRLRELGVVEVVPYSSLCMKTCSKIKQVDNLESSSDGDHSSVQTTDNHGKDNNAIGSELVNEVKNFIDIVIQALLRLRQFRLELLRIFPEHLHKGNPCLVCSFEVAVVSLELDFYERKKEVVVPPCLKTAVGNLMLDGGSFQKVNDVSETLSEIFGSLHKSFTCEEDDQETIGCKGSSCIVHQCFGMDILGKMHCSDCRTELRQCMYTSFFHRIDVHNRPMMKNLFCDNYCNTEAKSCRKQSRSSRMVSRAPRLFTLVLDWQNSYKSEEDIAFVLDTLTTEIDVAKLFDGLDKGKKYSVVCLICRSAGRYVCFTYRHLSKRWLMHDDDKVSVIWHWDDILSTCRRRLLQLVVLFFEALE